MKVIIGHLNADFDCLGAMIAAKKLHPDAKMAFPGAQEKNVRDFLRSFEYANILKFEKIKAVIGEITHLIIVDVRYRKKIGTFERLLDDPDITIELYDHHIIAQEDIIKGTIEHIKKRGATTTILIEELLEKKMTISREEATIMALGIYEDTGSFTFTTTTPEDLRAVSYLVSAGADLNIVSDFINKGLSTDQVTILNRLLESMEMININGVLAAFVMSYTDHYVTDLAIIVHKLKDMENLNIVFAIVQMADKVHLVLRSRIDAVDLTDIAHEFGGGGHSTAAYASISNMTPFEVKEKLLNILKVKIHDVRLAKDIMTSPVKTIDYSDTIKDGYEIMTRFNINHLPVLKNGDAAGILSKEIAIKGMSHGLGEDKVSEFMYIDFSAAYLDTPLHDIEKYLIEDKQKIVPVVNKDGHGLLGVITRGDLVRILYSNMLKKPKAFSHGAVHEKRYPVSRHMKTLITQSLPDNIIKLLDIISRTGDETGYGVYLVGGFVRDIILNIKDFDIDIVVEGDGISFAKKLSKILSGSIKTHEKFNTAVIKLPDGTKIDVATARIEYYKKPADLPVVETGSIKNDLARRDFTINAMAIKLNGENSYRLIDYFEGQNDLKDGVIRVLHSLSFVDDPTRAFRAIRFEQRFGFTIDKHTEMLLKNAITRGMFDRLSGKRLFTELKIILSEKEPVKYIKRINEFDLIRFIHPDIILSKDKFLLLENINNTVTWHSLLFLDKNISVWYIYLMGLLDGINDKDIEGLTMYLPRRYKDSIKKDRAILNITFKDDISNADIYCLFKNYSIEALLFLMARSLDLKVKRYISAYVTRLKFVKIEISGEDLKNLGISPGPLYKRILDDLLQAKLDGIISSKDEEFDFVKGRKR